MHDMDSGSIADESVAVAVFGPYGHASLKQFDW